MSVTLKKFTKKEYNQAQLMYFSGSTVQEIALALSLDPTTLRF